MKNITLSLLLMGVLALGVNSANAQVYCPGQVYDPSVEYVDSALVITWQIDNNDDNIQEVFYRFDSQDEWMKVRVEPRGKSFSLSLVRDDVRGEYVYWQVVVGNAGRWFDAEGVVRTERKLITLFGDN